MRLWRSFAFGALSICFSMFIFEAHVHLTVRNAHRKELKDLTFRRESAKSVRLELEQRVKDLQGQNAGLDGNQLSSKLDQIWSPEKQVVDKSAALVGASQQAAQAQEPFVPTASAVLQHEKLQTQQTPASQKETAFLYKFHSPSNATSGGHAISGEPFPPLDFGSPTMKQGVNGSKGGNPAVVFKCYRDDTNKFAFLHIPKNAGSALIHYMEELMCVAAGKGPECGLKLSRGQQCSKDSAYFVFTFTRNPWDRAVSMWSYGLKRKQLKTKDLQKRLQLAEKYCTFEEFVSGLEAKAISGEAVKVPGKGACGYHVSYRQHGSIYTRAGKPAVHFAGRLEHFDRDFKTILERIDPTGMMLEHYKIKGFTMHNDSGHKKYTAYYKNQRMKDAVAAFYSQDLELGYEFDTVGVAINPTKYADGKAAADLNLGDVRRRVMNGSA